VSNRVKGGVRLFCKHRLMARIIEVNQQRLSDNTTRPGETTRKARRGFFSLKASARARWTEFMDEPPIKSSSGEARWPAGASGGI